MVKKNEKMGRLETALDKFLAHGHERSDRETMSTRGDVPQPVTKDYIKRELDRLKTYLEEAQTGQRETDLNSSELKLLLGWLYHLEIGRWERWKGQNLK